MKKCLPRARFNSLIIKLLVVLLLIQFTSAQEVDLAEESGIYRVNSVNIKVYGDGFVDVEGELEVNKTIAGILTPRSIQDVFIIDSKGNSLQYDSNPVDDGQILTFYLRKPDDRSIQFGYRTLDLTSKEGSIWTFNFSTSSTPGHTIVRVEFPQGTDVLSLSPKGILRSPKNLTSLMLLYPQEKNFSFEYDYKINHVDDGGYGNMPYFIAAIVLLSLVMILFYFIFTKRVFRDVGRRVLGGEGEEIAGEAEDVITGPEEVHDESSMEISHIEDVTLVEGSKSRKIKSSVINMLEENERRVLEVMEGADDEITQAYIYKTTGIPKATLSDLMKRLEKRNIIERRRDGRINWIKLQKWIFSE